MHLSQVVIFSYFYSACCFVSIYYTMIKIFRIKVDLYSAFFSLFSLLFLKKNLFKKFTCNIFTYIKFQGRSSRFKSPFLTWLKKNSTGQSKIEYDLVKIVVIFCKSNTAYTEVPIRYKIFSIILMEYYLTPASSFSNNSERIF